MPCAISLSQRLGGVWRSNKKAWVASELMKKWLSWFNAQIGTERRALLLMDISRTHIQGVGTSVPSSEYSHPTAPFRIQQPLSAGRPRDYTKPEGTLSSEMITLPGRRIRIEHESNDFSVSESYNALDSGNMDSRCPESDNLQLVPEK